jgi:hypothetical protein
MIWIILLALASFLWLVLVWLNWPQDEGEDNDKEWWEENP